MKVHKIIHIRHYAYISSQVQRLYSDSIADRDKALRTRRQKGKPQSTQSEICLKIFRRPTTEPLFGHFLSPLMQDDLTFLYQRSYSDMPIFVRCDKISTLGQFTIRHIT